MRKKLRWGTEALICLSPSQDLTPFHTSSFDSTGSSWAQCPLLLVLDGNPHTTGCRVIHLPNLILLILPGSPHFLAVPFNVWCISSHSKICYLLSAHTSVHHVGVFSVLGWLGWSWLIWWPHTPEASVEVAELAWMAVGPFVWSLFCQEPNLTYMGQPQASAPQEGKHPHIRAHQTSAYISFASTPCAKHRKSQNQPQMKGWENSLNLWYEWQSPIA